MFPNSVMERKGTWNEILATLIKVRQQHGWYEPAMAKAGAAV
jgi:hypothetical protein